MKEYTYIAHYECPLCQQRVTFKFKTANANAPLAVLEQAAVGKYIYCVNDTCDWCGPTDGLKQIGNWKRFDWAGQQ